MLKSEYHSLLQDSWFFQGISDLLRYLWPRFISLEKIYAWGRVLLALLLFSCLFVPRFAIGSITSSYQVDLRTEDLLLLMIGALLLWVMIGENVPREILFAERSFLWFLLACEISILNGMFFRTIDKPLLSFLYLLKWVEYFLVFVATTYFAVTSKDTVFFLKVFFLLGIAAAGYGWWEHLFPAAKAVYPNYYRLYERAPFHGDANHIGGFLVLWLGFFAGIFLKTESTRTRSLLLAALAFVFFPFIWTYSRKSYFALAGALVFPFLFRGVRKKTLFLISSLIILAFFFPTRLSERLIDLGEAFSSTDPFHSSWAGNWVMWKESLWNFDKFFLFGSGFGSRHRLFYESQYILVLAETGIFGALAFWMMGVNLVRQVWLRLDQGVAFGWLIGFAGFLIHNASCVTWTVSKAAIPFWFLTATTLAYLRQRENAA